MLILSRTIGQSINIGDDVEVAILGIQNGQVKLGIAAPRSVSVHREEVYKRIQDEKKGSNAA